MARNEDLEGLSLADVLARLEAGKIGHAAAMEWTGSKTYNDLVELMHLNGRRMPGHRDMVVTAQTRALLMSIIRPRAGAPAKAARKPSAKARNV